MDVARRGRRPAAVQLRFGASVRRRAAPRARHRRRARLPGRRARGGHRHVRGLRSLIGPVRHDRDRRRVLRHNDPPRHDLGGGQRDGGGGRHRRHDRAERRSRGCPAVCPPRRAPDGAGTGLRRSRDAPACADGRPACPGGRVRAACARPSAACARTRGCDTAGRFGAASRRGTAGCFGATRRFGVVRRRTAGAGSCGRSRFGCRTARRPLRSHAGHGRSRGDHSRAGRADGVAIPPCSTTAAARSRTADCAHGAGSLGGRRSPPPAAPIEAAAPPARGRTRDRAHSNDRGERRAAARAPPPRSFPLPRSGARGRSACESRSDRSGHGAERYSAAARGRRGGRRSRRAPRRLGRRRAAKGHAYH
jgi:hypothetical protein